jgi:hypothetical protein
MQFGVVANIETVERAVGADEVINNDAAVIASVIPPDKERLPRLGMERIAVQVDDDGEKLLHP